MPELPEVETIIQALAPRLTGRVIAHAELLGARVSRGSTETRADRFTGMRVLALERWGKNIVVQLEAGVLVVHLGMTGKLLLDAPRTPYTRAVFHLDDGGVLLFDDIRQFGRIEWSTALPARIQALGPDPTRVTFEEFWQQLQGRSARIKPLLLNQNFLRGIGNIYADEALFRAGIHPKAVAGRLSPARAARLHEAIAEILQLAIAHRGSSISDYVDADGARGSFQELHHVYGRQAKPCVRCGAPIRRIVLGQRGTHYCGHCQR